MNKIIDFPEKDDPHCSGEAICLICKHTYVAVVPTGVTFFECPACGVHKVIFKYACERSDPHWQCNCGNKLFYLTPKGLYCPNCGDWQFGWEEK